MNKRLALVSFVLACHAAVPPQTAALRPTPLAPAGALVAAVELADALYLVAPDHIAIQRGTQVTNVPAPDSAWAEAITMPGLDDGAPWVVARTTGGTVWRVTAGGDLEPIHDLLGLTPPVRAIAASGTGANATVAFALDHAIGVLRERAHLAQFPAPPGATALAASTNRIAIRRADQLDVWDLAAQSHAALTVPGLLAAAFAGDTLVAASPTAVFVEDDHALHRLAAPAAVRALTVAGGHAWIATAAGVFRVDGEHLTRADLAASPTAVFGLPTGDLVTASPTGLARLAPARADDDPRWLADVQPVYRRVCAKCHSPTGDAIDLSTVAAWRDHKSDLRLRVVDTRSMPPAGTPITAADRDALARWLR